MSNDLQEIPEKDQPQLTELQANILSLWAGGIKPAVIAEQLKCSRNTVYSIMRRKETRKLFYQAQAEGIRDLVPLAIKRLKDVLEDKKTPAPTVVTAAREVLDRARVNEQAGLVENEISVTVVYQGKVNHD